MSTPAIITDAPDQSVISPAERYSRQLLFWGIGATGQERLSRSHVAIVGCGATGAATASLLARAGVGKLTLIDRDFVEPSNLQRQVLFDEDDARQSLPKAEAARRKIASFNSDIKVYAQIVDLVPANVEGLLSGADIILDGTDNFETRFLINDFAVQQGIPWIYAAALGSYAATMNILPTLNDQRSACLACLFPSSPGGEVETCDTAGILSTAVNFVASIQATETLKFLTGQIAAMRRTLISADLWTNERSEIKAGRPDPTCKVCHDREFTHLAGEGRPHITLCGRNSVQIHEHHRPINFTALKFRLEGNSEIEDLRSNQLLLRFRRGAHTFTLFIDGRAIVQGTTDVAVARSLYARFVGS